MKAPPGALGAIVARTRQRIDAVRRRPPQQALGAEAARRSRSLAAALARPARVNVIAELKRRSPSRGAIRLDMDPAAVARAYARNGAAGLSVLTEGEFFGGSLEDLRAARSACALPVLRKDFVVDACQVWEAAAAGADAVLLIVACLDPRELAALLRECEAAGVEALVELHDRAELAEALDAGARLLGVNSRDLRSMQVSLDTAFALAPAIPDDVVAVAESGIRGGADVRRLREAGYDAFLVGEHLMQAPEPGEALRVLIEEATDTAATLQALHVRGEGRR
jgi:indole-3-glycerol phosphate synthase